MITLQEVVDRNWQFFIREGGLPGVSGGGCVFRALDGGRCAIGCVLPEDMDIEEGPVADALMADNVQEFFLGVPFEALEDLADLHDGLAHHPYFHGRYRAKLRAFAADWGLTIPDSYLLDDPDQLLLFDDAVPDTQRQVTLIDMKAALPKTLVEGVPGTARYAAGAEE